MKINDELEEFNNMKDHDMLVKVVTILLRVEKGQNNHLEHHRRHDATMLGVTLIALFTAMLSIGGALLAIISKIH